MSKEEVRSLSRTYWGTYEREVKRLVIESRGTGETPKPTRVPRQSYGRPNSLL